LLFSVAALTVRIEAMKGHMVTHRKDFSSRRGMEAMMSKRRSLLKVRGASNFFFSADPRGASVCALL
jgi:ribosomal protein S15